MWTPRKRLTLSGDQPIFRNSRDLSNSSYWNIQRSTITDGFADPEGGTTAEQMLETAVTNTHIVGSNNFVNIYPGVYEAVTIAKNIGDRRCLVFINDGAFAESLFQNFNPANATVGTASGSTNMRVLGNTITALGNGYCMHKIRFQTNFSTMHTYVYCMDSAFATNYLGDVTKGLGIAYHNVHAIR